MATKEKLKNLKVEKLPSKDEKFPQKQLPVGKVIYDFFAAVAKAYLESGASVDVLVQEKKDRFSITVDGVTVAALLKRADSISMHLSKFKPYATTFTETMKKNLVSYGAAGFFFVGTASDLDKAVKAFMRHHDDLVRVRLAKQKGV